MGGSEAIEAFEASFEAALAREEDAAASDLAFSLRQDVDLRDAVARSGAGWALLTSAGGSSSVDEVGIDYVRAGTLVVRAGRATLRSAPGPAPATSDRTFVELLGTACRSGATVVTCVAAGRLARVAKDHVGITNGDRETIVGLAALESVRFPGYSASRGFSG